MAEKSNNSKSSKSNSSKSKSSKKEQTKEAPPENNELDQMLQPINTTEGSGIEDKLAELEEKKLDMVEKFISSDIQKTEISKSERKLLPLVRLLSENPFKLKEVKKGEFKNDDLSTFLLEYIQFGIPLDRKGRKEEVEVMQSVFQQDMEIKQDEGGIKDKLRNWGGR